MIYITRINGRENLKCHILNGDDTYCRCWKNGTMDGGTLKVSNWRSTDHPTRAVCKVCEQQLKKSQRKFNKPKAPSRERFAKPDPVKPSNDQKFEAQRLMIVSQDKQIAELRAQVDELTETVHRLTYPPE